MMHKIELKLSKESQANARIKNHQKHIEVAPTILLPVNEMYTPRFK